MSSTRSNARRPIRVLHSVGHLLRGGIETWLFQTLNAQRSKQLEHHVLVRTAEEESFTAAFRDAGIPVLVCSHFANPVWYAADFYRLVRKHGPYDVVHVHGSSFSGLLTVALAKAAGIPTIVHSHNDVGPHLRDRSHTYRAYVAGIMSAYRALASQGFAASNLAAESMFGAEWAKDDRWQLLYYGMDFNNFAQPRDPSLRETLGIQQGAFVIGHVGRFHEQKNHAFLVELVAEAAARMPEVHCLLIGDGPLRGEITAEIERRGLLNHFTFVPDTLAVSAYMVSVMDCFVFPSRYEGLGIVAIEAQAAGLSCLMSDRVPSEAIVNPPLVRVLPLERCAKEWAEVVLSFKDLPRIPASKALNFVNNSRFALDHCVSTLKKRYHEMAAPGQSSGMGLVQAGRSGVLP